MALNKPQPTLADHVRDTLILIVMRHHNLRVEQRAGMWDEGYIAGKRVVLEEIGDRLADALNEPRPIWRSK